MFNYRETTNKCKPFLSNSIFTITAVSHIIRLRLDKPRDLILDLDGRLL